jgi:hypothetical protein
MKKRAEQRAAEKIPEAPKVEAPPMPQTIEQTPASASFRH